MGMLCLCVLSLAGHAAEAMASEKIDDVRVLIDISGSMKRTDPQNLRIPAMRLFTKLLPAGTHAGVWTFGQTVNMIVSHATVDPAWKENALKKVGLISSSGLFTNIEAALKDATADWKQPDEKYNRNLILLTDGLVDVSKDAEANSQSRKVILEKYLPQLEKVGAKIHTIALSKESDHELLLQLASATGGWFETIETTEGLERLFLRLFEKVAQADSLPLKDNLVKIDATITELTFLIFRKDPEKDISLTTPSKKEISKSNAPTDITWYQDARYEMVTIVNPEVGNWKINADLDPDNRAMVVTDLQLKNTQIPNALEADSSVKFSVHLEEDGQIITRKEFLSFVRVKIHQSGKDNQEWDFRVWDKGKDGDEKKYDGIYTMELNESLIPGEHDIAVEVNGTTFKRVSRQTIKVYDEPVDVFLKPLDNEKYGLSIVPHKFLINSDAMRVVMEHKTPSGHSNETQVPRISPAEWSMEIDVQGEQGNHQIILHVSGNRPDGTPLDKVLSPREFTIGDHADNTGNTAASHDAAEMDDTEDTAETNWLMVTLRVLIFNVLLGITGFGAYKVWPRLKTKLLPNPSKELVYE